MHGNCLRGYASCSKDVSFVLLFVMAMMLIRAMIRVKHSCTSEPNFPNAAEAPATHLCARTACGPGSPTTCRLQGAEKCMHAFQRSCASASVALSRDSAEHAKLLWLSHIRASRRGVWPLPQFRAHALRPCVPWHNGSVVGARIASRQRQSQRHCTGFGRTRQFSTHSYPIKAHH